MYKNIMKGREFGLFLLGLLSFGSVIAKNIGSSKPNVVFILIDDFRPELSVYGNRQILTPTLDSLASSSIVFKRAYSSVAQCVPSRASMLTGLRPDSTGVSSNASPHFREKLGSEFITLPQHFKNNGYYTAGYGKVFHKKDLPSWSYRLKERTNQVTFYRDYYDSTNISNAANNSERKSSFYESLNVPDSIYYDGWITQQIIRHFDPDPKEPYFLAVGFTKPHLPFNIPKRYWDLYNYEKLELPISSDPQINGLSISKTSSAELRNYLNIPKQGILTDSLRRRIVQGYYASVSYVDEQIRMLLKHLSDKGLLENSIIVVWGDHGYKLGEYGEYTKHTNRELDLKVPMIFNHKDWGSGEISTIVEAIDIYPTLVDVCGLPPIRSTQGKSFISNLVSDELNTQHKAYALSQVNRGDLMGYSIKSDKFRYTAWYNPSTNSVLFEELYDHDLDSLETINVFDYMKYEEDILSHRKLLKEYFVENLDLNMVFSNLPCENIDTPVIEVNNGKISLVNFMILSDSSIRWYYEKEKYALGRVITPSFSGIYQVEIINEFGCEASSNEMELIIGQNCQSPIYAHEGINTVKDLNSQWFLFHPEKVGQLTLTTCDLTSEDTRIALYNDCENELASNNDACGSQSALAAYVTGGLNYYLQLVSHTGGSFDYNLKFTDLVSGEVCEAPISITAGPHTSEFMTNVPQWFQYEPNINGRISITSCDIPTEVRVGIFEECNKDAMAHLLLDSDSCNVEKDSWPVTKDSTYLIRWPYINLGQQDWNLIFKSSATKILDVSIPGQSGNTVIVEGENKIYLRAGQASGVGDFWVRPEIILAEGAICDPSSGVLQDFSSPVVYKVLAEDKVTEEEWTISIDFPLILGAKINKDKVNIYPAVANDYIYVESEIGISKIRIYSTSGIQMDSFSNTAYPIFVGAYSAGLYLIKVEFEDGQIFNRKIIKK